MGPRQANPAAASQVRDTLAGQMDGDQPPTGTVPNLAQLLVKAASLVAVQVRAGRAVAGQMDGSQPPAGRVDGLLPNLAQVSVRAASLAAVQARVRRAVDSPSVGVASAATSRKQTSTQVASAATCPKRTSIQAFRKSPQEKY